MHRLSWSEFSWSAAERERGEGAADVAGADAAERKRGVSADGRGFEPLVPCGTHAFQACTIDRSVTHPFNPARNRVRSIDYEPEHELQLQPAEQFIERQLNADKKFTKIRVLRAHWIKTHFVNDFLNLESIAREKRYAPFGIVQSS